MNVTFSKDEETSLKRKSIRERLPKWLVNPHSLFYYFLLLLGFGILFFAFSLFTNYFTTPFTGDYCAQQFAFYTNGYDDWWHFFKTGEFVLYDTNTYLGVDNIGSNSFYYLFDPFFLPILLTPRQLIPQSMAILTIFKLALAGLVFYAYMRYLGASQTSSKLTGIAYAFCGWTTWYLWFNHFTGVAVVLPLMLLGVEKVIKEQKPWLLALSTCVMGFVNFFFCITFTLLVFCYAMFRFFQKIRTHSAKENTLILFFGFIGFAIGLLMSAMVVLPSAMHALTSPRASSDNYLNYLKEAFKEHNFKEIMSLLTSWSSKSASDQNKARQLYPFIDYVFPVMSDRGTPLTVLGNESYDNVAGSCFCYIPMMMLLLPALINSAKQKHLSPFVALALFIFALFTPICYYAFHGFTQAYSRWTLIVTTSLLAYVGLYLDKVKTEKLWVLISGSVFLIALVLVACICAQHIVSKYSDSFVERVPIWLAFGLEVFYICIITVVFILFRKRPRFSTILTGVLGLEITLMGAFTIEGHGVADYITVNKGLSLNNVLHSLTTKVNKNDPTYFRSYSSLASETANNDGLRNDYNGTAFFHSIYNYNTADLSNWSSLTGGTSPASWSGTYVQKRINLDTLLGIKYYYVENDYFNYQSRREASSENFRYNVPFDYLDVTDQYPNSLFRVYKNMSYVDFALSYDNVSLTYGDPNTSNYYDGLYYSGNSWNSLSIENLYLQTAIINKRLLPNWEETLSEHPDITSKDATITSPGSIYNPLALLTYDPDYTPGLNRNIVTFYDIKSGVNSKGQKVDSLGLTAKEYVTMLERNNDTFVKTGTIDREEKSFRRYVGVIDNTSGLLPYYNPLGMVFYISLSYQSSYTADVYFVDENNKIVTYDNHNDGFTHATRTNKNWRAFYITPQYSLDENGQIVISAPAPKIKKIILASRDYYLSENMTIYVDQYENYKNRIDALNQHPVTLKSHSANEYKFTTNYDKERVVVTRLAYEDGFSLKSIDAQGRENNIPVFNGQGGFVSFIAPRGEMNYVLSFYTPYLKIASYLSSIGIFCFLSSIVAYYYVTVTLQENKKLKALLTLN